MSDPDARQLTSQASGTVMARRFLPGVFFLPIFLGWICLRGQTSGMYGIELGLALYAAASTIVLVAVIWGGARQMNKEYDQRSRVEVGIRELNTELEGRLEERTKTLGQRAAVLTEQAALLDLAQDAIVVGDMHSRILFWNLGAEAMFGWTSLEVLGTNTNALLKTEFSEAPEAIEATLLQQGRWRGEAVHRKRDGTRLIVASRWALQRDANGAPVRILTVSNDITDRKQAEAKLLLLTESLSLASEVAKVGVWDWDLASKTLTWDAMMFENLWFPAYGSDAVRKMVGCGLFRRSAGSRSRFAESHRRKGSGICGISHHPEGWLAKECFRG